MRAIVAVSIFLSLVLTGCLDTARVKRAPLDKQQLDAADQQTNVPGVPFYIKVGKCKQETVWLQPYYALTLKRTTTTKFVDETRAKDQDDGCKACNKACAGSPPADVQACNKCTPIYKACKEAPQLPAPQVAIGTQVLSLGYYQKPEVRDLQVEVGSYNSAATSAPTDIARIDGLWKTILSWPFYLPLTVKEDVLVASADAIEVSNKAAPEKVIDYSRTYYYNTPRPWAGSSQLDVHLDPDQTLTEASSQVQSQTLSTILSALPISSVLKYRGNGGAGRTQEASGCGSGRPVRYEGGCRVRVHHAAKRLHPYPLKVW